MKSLRQIRGLIVYLGTNTSPWIIVGAFLTLNVYWPVLLWVLDEQFRKTTGGLPLLDLQNSLVPGQIVTPTRVLDQLPAYTDSSVLLYWIFFGLDNVFPLLVFGSYALLWVCLWRNSPDRVSRWLLGSYVMVVPLGIQFFDWGENLFYVLAIHNHPEAGTVPAIYAGLVFKWLKAACVVPTTLLTPVFLAYFLYGRVRSRLRRGHLTGGLDAQAANPAHEHADREGRARRQEA